MTHTNESPGLPGRFTQLEYRYLWRDSTWQDVDQRDTITHSPCHLGAERPWFVCPNCQQRVGILYLWHTPRCRKCARLVYASQSVDAFNRSWARTDTLEARFAGGNEKWNFRRPKGMRVVTYERLKLAYLREQINRDDALMAFANRMGWLD